MMFYDGSVTCRLDVRYPLPTTVTGSNCKLPYDFGWEFNSHPSSGDFTSLLGQVHTNPYRRFNPCPHAIGELTSLEH